MHFDQRLKAKAIQKDFTNSSEKEKWKRTIIRVSLTITTIVYIFLNPLTNAGNWCLNGLENKRGHLPRDTIFLKCQAVS